MIESTHITSTRLKVLLYSLCSYSVKLFYVLNVPCKEVENVLFFHKWLKNQSELKNIKHGKMIKYMLIIRLINWFLLLSPSFSHHSLPLLFWKLWLRLPRLVTGLKISRQYFNQWEAILNAPYRRDVYRALCKLKVIMRNSDWLIVLLVMLWLVRVIVLVLAIAAFEI